MNVPRNAIVVGVDGSADADRALDWAAGAAAVHGVGIHLVNSLPQVVTDLPYWHAEEQRDIAFSEKLLADARARLEPAHLQVTSESVDLGAVPALLAAAEDAMMVVVGARGHSALTGFLIGSVSQHVSGHARCPVVVVREPADPRATTIVVGVDGSSGSDKAIGFAFDQASRTHAPLVAIYAWHEHHGKSSVGYNFDDLTEVGQRVDAGERRLAEALAGWTEKYPDVTVSRAAVPVHPVRALTDASHAAALVVVGSHGLGTFTGLMLGSVSQGVLHGARCPVAVVR